MSTFRRLRRASCSSGVIWLRAGTSLSPLPRLPPRLGSGLSSGMISASPLSSSLKSTGSVLAFLAGRPGLRPVGAFAAFLAAGAALAAVLRAVFTAAPVAAFSARFLGGAVYVSGSASGDCPGLTRPPAFTAALSTLFVAAMVLDFFAVSSTVWGVLPVTWVIGASVGAKALGPAKADECCR